MPKGPFYRLGKFIFKFRLLIILLWALIILACFPFIPNIMTPFKSTGFVDKNSPSVVADNYLNKKISYNANRFLIIYHSKTLLATDASYIDKLKKSLSELKDFPLKHEILYPDNNKKQISKDKHTAYVVILFKDNKPISPELLTQFKHLINTPSHMSMQLGGEPFFIEGVNEQTQKDLFKADFIATPVAIVTLILVFGSLTAAILPILLGGGCALIILTTLYLLGHAFTLSIFTINIALLLGLCLSLDYSLFIINRFRDELNKNKNIREVIAITVATAGKAIFYSGLAVFISLSALLLFPINILFSVGVGGLSAVFFAVAIAVLLLPAILGVLKENINLFSVKFWQRKKQRTSGFWGGLAAIVVKRPLLFFISILTFLIIIGLPFLHARFGVSDYHILPEQAQARQFFDIYQQKFKINELSPILLIVKAHEGKIISKNNIAKLYDFAEKLKKNSLIAEVNSIVTTEPHLSKDQYYNLYNSAQTPADPAIHKLLITSTQNNITVMSIVSKYAINSPQINRLIKQLRALNPGDGLSFQLTGVPVKNVDVLHGISTIFPYAIIWIMVLTYIILLILLRSLVLPLKAILMNILSLFASYGVLVFIFQEGHFHHLLNFDPQGILDITLLIIIFCALFGFSMDYEVFLLTRIKEDYEKHKNNDESIIFGIEHSSRIITSAALIVIFICGSFMVADVLMVKEFGLGIAVAIFVDAFLIRSILVPATMALMKQWNWYLPKCLGKILPKQ